MTLPQNTESTVQQSPEVELAEKVVCGECKGSGDTSVSEAINWGAHRCTDCNGNGFNWEPIN